jgi:hypothetical protein
MKRCFQPGRRWLIRYKGLDFPVPSRIILFDLNKYESYHIGILFEPLLLRFYQQVLSLERDTSPIYDSTRKPDTTIQVMS